MYVSPERQALKRICEEKGMTNKEFKRANKKMSIKLGMKYKYIIERNSYILMKVGNV